ncbi:jerky [Penicillium malachiteum]|nr:jerky [Penicillium malachiteum]
MDKEVTDTYNTIEELVLSQFQGPKTEEYINEEDAGQEIDMQLLVMLADALRGLRGLITFYEQQETPDIAYIKRLRQDEIDM